MFGYISAVVSCFLIIDEKGARFILKTWEGSMTVVEYVCIHVVCSLSMN